MKNWRALGLAAAGLMVALPAFSQTANPKAPNGGTIIHAHVSGMDHFDPAMFCTTVQLETGMHMYEGLMMMGEDYSSKPMLASSVVVTPDGKTFTFALRKGVKFHNGKEMTSADVVATYKRYVKISPNAAAFAAVTSFDAPDPYTFIINLKETSAVLLDVLKTPCFPLAILPSEEAAKGAREITPIGTGPYQLGELVKDSHLVLRRFPGYVQDTSAPGPDGFAGRKTAHIETIRYNFLPEVSSRVAAMLAGAADISDIDADQVDRFTNAKQVGIAKVFPGCMHVIMLQSQNGLTRDVRIRQAIAAVVDVEEMAEVSGYAYKLNPSLLYPDSPYYDGEQMKQYYNQKNPAKAKELLKAAGYKGEKIIIHTNSNYGYMRAQMLVLEQKLKAIGMNVEMRVTDWITNSAALQTGEGGWNISMSGYCSQPLLGPQQWRPLIYAHTGLNKANDTEIDSAYATFFGSLDVEARKKAWLAAETGIRSKAYLVKIADAGRTVAVRNRVHGWKPWYALRNWDLWLD
ncbi:MAG: ABC transporter substrate-binding protein [Acetobacteraceae bacterium]|nr:ABC transporter substrate-binding protein [Acetobacteraceae bacterium]